MTLCPAAGDSLSVAPPPATMIPRFHFAHTAGSLFRFGVPSSERKSPCPGQEYDTNHTSCLTHSCVMSLQPGADMMDGMAPSRSRVPDLSHYASGCPTEIVPSSGQVL